MGKCVVTDFVSFPVNSFYDGNIIFCIDTYQEKSSRNIFPAQYIKNLRRIKRVWSVVESKYKFFFVARTVFFCQPFGGKINVDFSLCN